MTEHSLVLPGGRQLHYAVYGTADGLPILYFHGTPSSRLEPGLLNFYGVDIEGYLAKKNLRLIAVDRPGMGLSTFNPGGSFLSFADDAARLLAALHISSCPLMCWSGGGSYALAMAWKYPSLIKNVFILCGFSRQFTKEVTTLMTHNKWYFRTARYTPWLLGVALNAVRHSRSKNSVPQWITGLPDADYHFLKEPEGLRQLLRHTVREACRKGTKGAIHEARLYYKPLGFDIADIQQPVHYWWGTLDNTVIHLHAKAVEEGIKNSVLHYKRGEAHLSLWVHYFTEVLDTVLSASPAP